MKNITLQIEVPDKYNWIARQPFGTWTAFIHKPKIYRAVEDEEEDGFIPEFWEVQKDELEIAEGGEDGNWKGSLRQI